MGYKVAGIDVHKKVLMVVVCEVGEPEQEAEVGRRPMDSQGRLRGTRWIGKKK